MFWTLDGTEASCLHALIVLRALAFDLAVGSSKKEAQVRLRLEYRTRM